MKRDLFSTSVIAALAFLAYSPVASEAMQRTPPGPAMDNDMPPRRQRGMQGDGPRGPRRGPDGARRGGPPGPNWQRMSDTDRRELRQFVAEHFPRLNEELQRARSKNPERFRKRMRRLAPEFLDLMMMSKRHPDQATLLIRERRYEMSIRRLVRQYNHTEDKLERKSIRKEVADLAGKVFDCRHERRAMEIKTFELRLEELRERHAEAAGMREQIVNRLVNEHLSGNSTSQEREWGKSRRPGNRDQRRGPPPGGPRRGPTNP